MVLYILAKLALHCSNSYINLPPPLKVEVKFWAWYVLYDRGWWFWKVRLRYSTRPRMPLCLYRISEQSVTF